MDKEIVIALGGNALIKEGEKGTIPQQYENVKSALKDIVKLIKDEYKIVITHGNGPQVGAIIIRSECALDKTYEIPLSAAVAQSQGEIGTIITEALNNELKSKGIKKDVVTVLTHVICDKNDSSIKNPTKPIGPFYDSPSTFKWRGISFVEDAGRGYRRVVPSPKPLKIVERDVINDLVEKGFIVIAAGGGGIPVYLDENGQLQNIEGVIDKDLASSVLANSIGADQLIILTYVEKVALNFNKPNQKWLDKMTVKEAKKYLKEGQFQPGSMGPKIEAAIKFLEKGEKRVIITSINKLSKSLKENAGTLITKS